MSDLPAYYFRSRERGAAVFRVDTENRQRRIELHEIAFVNEGNGKIRPHGDVQLSEADLAEIGAWLAARRQLQLRRERDEIFETIERLNSVAHWAQTRANEALLDEMTDGLLLAMHDLRSILVRRKAEQLGAASGSAAKDAAKGDIANDKAAAS